MNEQMLKKLGIQIGHYTDAKNLKGTTVFIAEKGASIGIDVRGVNTGTFNTPIYGMSGTAETVNAVVLTGGSIFGLESSYGVMQYLEEHRIGYQVGPVLIPGVTGAVIFDLGVGSGIIRPGKKEGYIASANAAYTMVEEGNVGVGIGATVGKWVEGKRMKGGFGMAIVTLPNDIFVGAFVVTNSLGDIVNPKTNKFYSEDGGYDVSKKIMTRDVSTLMGLADMSPYNTTLAVIATNVALDRRQLTRVAELAHDGMARAIFPVHTMLDGDVVFALSSLSGERKVFPNAWSGTMIDVVGIGAQDALMKAINSSVIQAKSIDGFPSYAILSK